MKKFSKDIDKIVDQLLLSEEGVENAIASLDTIDSFYKLPGDASTRRYFRIGSGEKTYILMKMEPFLELGADLPFLAIQRFLDKKSLPVPKVHHFDPERGYFLLEDLGETTLLHRLQSVCDVEVERQLYEKVIDSLVDLQVLAKDDGKVELPAFTNRFDFEKLFWEVNFTIEHFYETHLKRNFSEKDRTILNEGFRRICQTLADQETVFTHRDFHSRNIMVQGEDDRLVMIDFQDARLGPQAYDLASLLKDSYYQLSEQQVQRLIDYYIARWEAKSGSKLNRPEFLEVFDLMSVQRNFKAIGSFASFLNRRGNATYLKYIGNTFENIRRVLLKYPDFSDLREVLFYYYYF